MERDEQLGEQAIAGAAAQQAEEKQDASVESAGAGTLCVTVAL